MDLRRFEILVSRSENLPTMPSILTDIISQTFSEESSIGTLESKISLDPAVSAKIMRVANSAFYGESSKCTTLTMAISILGFHEVRALVTSLAYHQMMRAKSLSKYLSKSELWKHSLATAECAKILAKKVLPNEIEELYLAGLMHDIGFLALDVLMPNELDVVVKTALTENSPLHEIERDFYRWDHSDAGGALATKWGLPPVLSNTIRYHHRPLEAEKHLEHSCVIALANDVAHQCGFTNHANTAIYETSPMILKIVGLSEEEIQPLKEEVVEKVTTVQSAFGID